MDGAEHAVRDPEQLSVTRRPGRHFAEHVPGFNVPGLNALLGIVRFNDAGTASTGRRCGPAGEK